MSAPAPNLELSVQALAEGRFDREALRAEQAAARERLRQARRPDPKPSLLPRLLEFPKEQLIKDAAREEALLQTRKEGNAHRKPMDQQERRRRDEALANGGNGTRVRAWIFNARRPVTAAEISHALDMPTHCVVNYMPALVRLHFVLRRGQGGSGDEYRYTSTERRAPGVVAWAKFKLEPVTVKLVGLAAAICEISEDRILSSDRRAMSSLGRWLVYDALARRGRSINEIADEFGFHRATVEYGLKVIAEYREAREDKVALFRAREQEVAA